MPDGLIPRVQTILLIIHIAIAGVLLRTAGIQETSAILQLNVVYLYKTPERILFQLTFVYDVLFLTIYVKSMKRALHS